MEAQELVNYVMKSPENTNPNILLQLANELKNSGGGGEMPTGYGVTFLQTDLLSPEDPVEVIYSDYTIGIIDREASLQNVLVFNTKNYFPIEGSGTSIRCSKEGGLEIMTKPGDGILVLTSDMEVLLGK